MNIVYNMDCMEFMKDKPDNYYELAICDVNYGIKQDGRKNHTRGCLAKSKDYSKNYKYDDSPPDKSYFIELFRVSKNQILWGQIILLRIFVKTHHVGLYGIKIMEIQILLIANLPTPHLKQQ